MASPRSKRESGILHPSGFHNLTNLNEAVSSLCDADFVLAKLCRRWAMLTLSSRKGRSSFVEIGNKTGAIIRQACQEAIARRACTYCVLFQFERVLMEMLRRCAWLTPPSPELHGPFC